MRVAILSILIIGLCILLAAGEKNNPLHVMFKHKNISGITAQEFVDTIDSLGYFKYADTANIEKLRQSHLNDFDPEGVWGGIWDEETNIPMDYRYYYCDGEYVFEQGGFVETLQELGATFKKLNFTLTIDDHFEEYDMKNKWLNHRITINGTEHIIFKNYTGYGWGEAVLSLAEIINAELEKQQIDERIYLISGGNDGSLIFLNDDLYKYFYTVFTDPQWKPLNTKEWASLNHVKSSN